MSIPTTIAVTHSIISSGDVLQESGYSADEVPGTHGNQSPPESPSQSPSQPPNSFDQQSAQQAQQAEHEQESRLADSTVLEWCSKAEELMQQASVGKQDMAGEQAVAVQSPFGALQRDLTALPAYSGNVLLMLQ